MTDSSYTLFETIQEVKRGISRIEMITKRHLEVAGCGEAIFRKYSRIWQQYRWITSQREVALHNNLSVAVSDPRASPGDRCPPHQRRHFVSFDASLLR